MVTKPVRAVGDTARWVALAVLLAGTLLDLLDATVVNIALPTIQRDLGTSFALVQWIPAGYTLAFALGLVTGGRLGDIWGRKRVFLWAMAAFTVTSVLAGAAVGGEMLVAARVLQGLAAAAMVPQVLSFMHVTFPPAEIGKAFGIFGAVCGIGVVAGPIVGAVLSETDVAGLSWRPIFLINVPIGIAALLVGRRYITESRSSSAPRLDLVGVVLAAAGLTLLLFPLTVGREVGWPWWCGAMLVGSAIVLAGFVFYERHRTRTAGSPLVDMSLFRIRSFSAGTVVQIAFGSSFGLFALCLVLYMQLGLGWSPLRTALTTLMYGATMGVVAMFSVQFLVPRFGRRVLHTGAALMILGMALFGPIASAYGPSVQWWQLAAPLVLGGCGLGMFMAPLTAAVLAEVPMEHAGSASGLVNTVNQVGLSLGVGLASVAFFNVIDSDTSGAAAVGFNQAVIDAFNWSLWWVVGLIAMSFVLLFAMPRNGGSAPVEPAPAAGLPETDREAVGTAS